MDQRKRYQIFVSSTFADLEEERAKVMKTILNFDCFPAGMELFPAMDEEIFEYIKRIIDDSDYFLLIIGGSYGSVDGNGISWTEKEYDYAVKRGIPVIVFDHKDFTKIPADRTDLNDKKRKKLIAFKEKVSKDRLIKKWTNIDDLDANVAKSLHKVLENPTQIGWVRADSVASSNTQKEIQKFKIEIADRQDEIKRLKKEINGLETNLKNKDKNYQQEIAHLNEHIKALEAELNKNRDSSGTIEVGTEAKTEIFTVNGVSFKMVYVEGGTFIMGANDHDKKAGYVERPAHEVTLSKFWIGETQVTQALWQAVMGYNPSKFNGDNLPVENVNWSECKDFIRNLNKLTGKKFRLPTEAQWEFAARGGNLGKENEFLFAGNYDVYDVAWYDDNSENKTHPVKTLDPNELGLYDMSGNVWEWCQDWYESSYYQISPTIDPKGPAIGNYRVNRGGSWRSNIDRSRVTFRGNSIPSIADDNVGLRLAL